MLKKFIATALVAMAIMPFAFAQNGLPCGANEAMEELAKSDPDYARFLAGIEQRNLLISSAASLRQQQSQYTIPVVVHIMHDYGSSNISKAQVLDAIRVLNEDFNKLNSDTSQVIAAFQGIYANAGISFKLATKDPNGNCTEGITRTYTQLTNAADNEVKNLIRWNPAKYLNIWVANTMASGSGGYSYLPCVSPLIDGIVLRNSQFGSIGTSSGNGLSARTLTHEVGHYLGLPHTWGGTNNPGLASNCNTDDGIADTPNTIGVTNQGCNTGASTCGTLNNVQNFMDYANCPKMFTFGQRAVMYNALQMSCRNTLWATSNLLSTGTAPGMIAGICTPKADFSASHNRICEGGTINFLDLSYNAPVDSRTWYFPGGTPSVSTDLNPTVVYSTPGIYPVVLKVANAQDSDSLMRNSYIHVVATSGITAPFTEGFTETAFPAHASNSILDWELVATSTNTWTRHVTAYGEPVLRIRNNFIGGGVINSVISPSIDLSHLTGASLSFDVSYARANNNANDQLRVYLSNDCGRTWSIRYNKSGATLSTVGTTLLPNFEPANSSASYWRTETIALNNAFNASPNLRVKFESVSASGNIIYIDNINIGGVLSAANQLVSGTIALYPNPANNMINLQLSLAQNASISGSVIDVVGREVALIAPRTAEAGQIDIPVNISNLPSGVYFVRVMDGSSVVTRKFVKE